MEQFYSSLKNILEISKRIFRSGSTENERSKEKPRILLQTPDALVVQLTNSREMDMIKSPEIMRALGETGYEEHTLVQLILGHLNHTAISESEHDEPEGSAGQPNQFEHVIERGFEIAGQPVAVRDDILFPAVTADVDLLKFNVSSGSEIILGQFGSTATLAVVIDAHEEGGSLVATRYDRVHIGPNTLAILKPRAANKWTFIPNEPLSPFRMIYMRLKHPTQPEKSFKEVIIKS